MARRKSSTKDFLEEALDEAEDLENNRLSNDQFLQDQAESEQVLREYSEYLSSLEEQAWLRDSEAEQRELRRELERDDTKEQQL